MTMATVLWFVLGGAALILGAEILVRGASRLALAAGISPLVVGLTVVAFGTGSPELAVTVDAAYTGKATMALGNAVGSNIFNVLVVLGLSAVISPLVVDRQLVRLDVPLMILASAAVLLLGLDGVLGRADGFALFAAVFAYVIFLVRQSRSATAGARSDGGTAGTGGRERRIRWLMDLGLIAAGLGLLVVGAEWLVAAAVDTAAALGVSEMVIGLTIVAVGTSLPEVATSVLASIRGERDIAVGNVVGSCVFNLLAVLGLGSIVAPAGIPVPAGALTFDIPVMIGVAVAALPVLYTGYAVARWEGGVFVVYYGVYTAYLVLTAAEHDSLPAFRTAMLYFVLPLTVLPLLLSAGWALATRRSDR